MISIVFVQGGGEGVHDGWDDKLVESLRAELGPGFHIRYPRMPHEAEPKYQAWKERLVREFASLSDGMILAGHSIGASILVNVLAEAPPDAAIAGIFLIAAPFIGEGGWTPDGFEPRSHLGAALPKGVPVFLYRGADDDTVPSAHVHLYEAAIPKLHVRRLAGRDHQLNNNLAEVAQDIKNLIDAQT